MRICKLDEDFFEGFRAINTALLVAYRQLKRRTMFAARSAVRRRGVGERDASVRGAHVREVRCSAGVSGRCHSVDIDDGVGVGEIAVGRGSVRGPATHRRHVGFDCDAGAFRKSRVDLMVRVEMAGRVIDSVGLFGNGSGVGFDAHPQLNGGVDGSIVDHRNDRCTR